MKATILRGVHGERLGYVVPPAYRELMRKKTQKEGTYTVLLFPHSERDVVTSTPVRKTFRQLKNVSPDGIVAVGSTFTKEAKQILAEHKATIVTLREGDWTDATANERQL